jgi:hypothetical protein
MIRPFSRLHGIFNGFRPPSQAIDINGDITDLRVHLLSRAGQ